MPPSARYRRAVRSVDPADLVLDALELTHPSIAAPVRVVNDTDQRTIGGENYAPVPFRALWPDAAENRRPRARIAADNVGRDLTQWVESTQGAAGGTCRLIRALAATGEVEAEVTLDVAGAAVAGEEVALELEFGMNLQSPVVLLRHDPERSPGLF